MNIYHDMETAAATIHAQQLEIARLELQIAQLTGDLRQEHTCCRCPRPGEVSVADGLYLCARCASGEQDE